MGGLMSDLQAEAYVDPRVVDLNRGKQVCSYFVQRLLTLITSFALRKVRITAKIIETAIKQEKHLDNRDKNKHCLNNKQQL